MLYTQIFQELYYQADFNCGGRLPIHVTFMLDEFANVALPDGFCSLLSTMRSREISSIIIIQNFAQLKALFKYTWETIPGNCDTFIYLGGNEQSSGGEKPIRNPEREKPKWEDTITNRMLHWSYTSEQKEEVKKAIATGVPKETILTYFYHAIILLYRL